MKELANASGLITNETKKKKKKEEEDESQTLRDVAQGGYIGIGSMNSLIELKQNPTAGVYVQSTKSTSVLSHAHDVHSVLNSLVSVLTSS